MEWISISDEAPPEGKKLLVTDGKKIDIARLGYSANTIPSRRSWQTSPTRGLALGQLQARCL